MESIEDLIKKNDTTGLHELLNSNPALANGKTAQGFSYLLLAAYYRNHDAIQLIREKRNKLDLYEAASIGDLNSVMQHLTNQPSSIHSYSSDGFTPLGLACYFGHLEIVKYLVNHGADVNKASSNSFHVAPIHSATAISDYEITAFLLEYGADVNAKQQSGVTPLHSAAHNGKLNIAKLLVDHGADINAKTSEGKTPADMAFEKNYADVGEYLTGLR